MIHWIYCNVYTQSYTTVQKKISDLHDEYVFLRNCPVKKRKDDFILLFNTLFDIKGSNDRIISQGKLCGTERQDDFNFYENQRLKNPPVGYCTSFLSRKWKIQKGKLRDEIWRAAAFEKTKEH